MIVLVTEHRLSLRKIADYWARETGPITTMRERLDEFVHAYWRGELQPDRGPNRLYVLRWLYRDYRNQIAFVVPGCPEPAKYKNLPDGGVRVLRRVRVQLPSSDPGTWSEVACTEAFATLASDWEKMPEEVVDLLLPAIAGAQLTREQFLDWAFRKGFDAPEFWGKTERGADQRGTKREVAQAVIEALNVGSVGKGHGKLTQFARGLHRQRRFQHFKVETITRYVRQALRDRNNATARSRHTKR